MVIREEKKMLKGDKLTRAQKNDYRRKKLVELRKGTGSGAPVKVRSKTKGTFNNPFTQTYMNELRDKEIKALQTRMEEYEMAQHGKLD